MCCLRAADPASHRSQSTIVNSPLLSLAYGLNPIGAEQGDGVCPPVPSRDSSGEGVSTELSTFQNEGVEEKMGALSSQPLGQNVSRET